MLKIVDEVRYDLFRRVLAAVMSDNTSADPAHAVLLAGQTAKLAVENLVSLGIVADVRLKADAQS